MRSESWTPMRDDLPTGTDTCFHCRPARIEHSCGHGLLDEPSLKCEAGAESGKFRLVASKSRLATGRPGGTEVRAGVLADVPRAAAISAHDVDLGIAITAGREGDRPRVG